jgi:hypothetical protein
MALSSTGVALSGSRRADHSDGDTLVEVAGRPRREQSRCGLPL